MKPRIAIPTPTSFDPAYNRLNYPAYADSVRASGGEPFEVTLDQGSTQLERLAESCEGILLPGSPADVNPEKYGQVAESATSPADPAREFTDETLIAWGLKHGKPVFGICFGAQMINVWCGGTLIQDLNVMPVNHSAGRSVGVAHTASVAADSLLAGIVDQQETEPDDGFVRLPVNSSHHQAVGIVGAGLHVAARCVQDGVVEAIEAMGSAGFVLGVQWHPERTFAISATSRALFARFVAEATLHAELLSLKSSPS